MKPSTLDATVSLQPADFERIVREHQSELWRYLRYLGCERHLVDDFVQEAFLTLLEKPFEERSRPATAAYLRLVARNLYLMALRRSSRAPVFEDLEAAERAWVRHTRDDGGESYLEALRECFSNLKDKAHRALELRFAENLSRLQIADALELSEDGVKSLMRRARRALRECVQRRLP